MACSSRIVAVDSQIIDFGGTAREEADVLASIRPLNPKMASYFGAIRR